MRRDTGFVAVIGAAVIALAACGSSGSTSKIPVNPTTNYGVPVSDSAGSGAMPAPSPTTPATTQAPAPVATTPTTPAITAAQQQAVDAAQNYLSDGQGFSAYSLAHQLTSSYGDGFSQADAQFAINYLNPDWDTQAVDAAQGYMKMGGFSAASLTQQLTSDYGNGFTSAQAAYAVAKVGL